MLISFPVQAKPETVDKGREIVKKQWALSTDTPVTGASKFAALGADSLDTVLLGIFIATSESVFCFVLLLTSSSGQVEVVMGLEEEFGIGVGEESAQSIATGLDATDLIEKRLTDYLYRDRYCFFKYIYLRSHKLSSI